MSITEIDTLPHERTRPKRAFFEANDGGLLAADGSCIYFMGIIDILTVFGKKKVLENLGKKIIYDG